MIILVVAFDVASVVAFAVSSTTTAVAADDAVAVGLTGEVSIFILSFWWIRVVINL